MAKIVIGIDGGGTHTRVIAANFSGHILATTKAGAASPEKTSHAQKNIQNAIREVVAKAHCELGDVVELVAGIAGLDEPEDQVWAEKFTDLPGLDCPRLHVNDAVVAHAGALQSQPGIIAISGTGSIVFGVTEAGRHLRNYDFHHYAYSAARFLSYEVVYRILAEDFQLEDSEFIAEVLAFWKAKNIAELRELGTEGFVSEHFERTRLFGEMAPLVTKSAKNGVPLAQSVCDVATDALGIGIRLLGNCFTSEIVSVALIGSVVQSEYLKKRIEYALAKSLNKHYQIVDAAFPSEVGAVLMALRRHEIVIDDKVLSTLKTNTMPFHNEIYSQTEVNFSRD